MSLGFNLGQTGNASEVGAGIVKLATQAQIDAGQADDGGVPLVVTPDKIPKSGVFQTDYLADEDLVAGEAVARESFDTFDVTIDQQTSALGTSYSINPDTARAIEFTTNADQAGVVDNYSEITVQVLGANQNQLTATIRLTPSGADEQGFSQAIPNGAGNKIIDVRSFNFAANTTYYLVFTRNNVGGSNPSLTGDPGGSQNGWEIGNPSGSWTDQNIEHYFVLRWEVQATTANTIIKASAAALLNGRINFVGFVTEDTLTGNPVTIANSDIIEGSGFTPGATYYLSDTNGQITTTPGTIERVVGRALSATTILRKRGPVSPVSNFGSIVRNSTAYCPLVYMTDDSDVNLVNILDGSTARILNHSVEMLPGDSINSDGATSSFVYARLMDYEGIS